MGVDPIGVEGAVTLTWKPNVVVNDDFANAIALGGNSGSVTGWNVGATLEPPDEPGSTTCCLGNSVWYSWTPTANGAAQLTLNSDTSERISVYTGTTLADLQFLTFNTFDADAGKTYWIQIGPFDSSPGTFNLSWNLTLRPPNDDWLTRRPVTGEPVARRDERSRRRSRPVSRPDRKRPRELRLVRVDADPRWPRLYVVQRRFRRLTRRLHG